MRPLASEVQHQIMHLQSNHQSDDVIISLLAKRDKRSWEFLYDKYASVMYGTILGMVNDQETAGDILVAVFVELKEKEMLFSTRVALCHTLIRLTYTITNKNLRDLGLPTHDIKTIMSL
jgi:hypothetical protein